MKKRYHFSNGRIEMSFEMRTGECIEMIDVQTGENILKSHSRKRGMPFQFSISDETGTVLEAYPVRNMTLLHQPELYAQYQEADTNEGPQLTITYPAVETSKGLLDVSVTVTIILLRDSTLSRWQLSYQRNTDAIKIRKVRFPALAGIYLGEHWQDDSLLYPMWRGIRVNNPVEIMPTPSPRVGSRWMEYFQSVETDHVTASRSADGAYAYSLSYGGCCCMRWMALTDPEETFYIGSHDEELRAVTLEAETFGPELVGMNFSLGYVPEENNNIYSVPPAYVGLFSDWHNASRFYRKWLNSVNKPEVAPVLPEWVEQSSDMVVHYDFKDQCGDIQHTYRDLPNLKDFCIQTGLKHLMLAGWDQGGFNVRMPVYRYDSELGTEQEFIDGVRALRDAGIHVACYINVDVVNRETEEEFPELFREACAIGEDQKRIIKIFSNKAFVDYQMCSAHPMWIEHLRQCVHYLTDTIGCDGVYFDCLSSSSMCYSKNHNHKIGEHVSGKKKLLETLTKEYTNTDGKCSLVMFGEGLTDALGSYLSGQLGTTYMHHLNAYPEMYRYTFPEHLILDMVYPFRSQGMRAAPVSYWWKELMDRVFLTGMNYWIYDDEEYGSFRNDPIRWDYLKRLISLRLQWFTEFGRGRFEDELPLASVSGGKAKAFSLSNNNMLITFVPDKSEKICKIVLKDQGFKSVILYNPSKVPLESKKGSVTFKTDEPVYLVFTK